MIALQQTYSNRQIILRKSYVANIRNKNIINDIWYARIFMWGITAFVVTLPLSLPESIIFVLLCRF